MSEISTKSNPNQFVGINEGVDEILHTLNSSNVRYGLYAGAHIDLLSGNEIDSDIDLIVHNDDGNLLCAILSDFRKTTVGTAKHIQPSTSPAVDIMYGAVIAIGSDCYPFYLTDLAFAYTKVQHSDTEPFRTVDPVDTFLLKAILQRSEQEGKKDIADIITLLGKVTLDLTYLGDRIEETRSIKRVTPILNMFGIEL